MPICARRSFPAALLALALLALTASHASAVIMKLTPLAEVLETEDFIFVAAVDKIDPNKPSAIFKVEKNLKGESPFDRIPVNMTGNAEAKKNNDTKTVLDRLDASRKVVFFVSKRGKKYNAMAFVEGSWFSMQGTQDETDSKVVRWAFQNGEPFLRRTFKGTSPELIKIIEDGLAKKAKPPAPDEKEKAGYGPAVEKKCGPNAELPNAELGTRNAERSEPVVSSVPRSEFRTPSSGGSALFGVIPSFVLVGPLAIIAALFPGVFARLAVGMKRWRAFLVIASLNSSLALIFFFVQKYLPSGWWFGTKAFTLYLMTITAIGLVWAGLRYRRFAAEEPAITDSPKRIELYVLGGLTLFAGVSVCLTGYFMSWGTNLELPMREFTFIGIALAASTLYATYRMVTARADHKGEQWTPTDRRLSLSGESVGLGILFLCGFSTFLHSGSSGFAMGKTEEGDAESIGPRLMDVKVFVVKLTQKPEASQVLSGITISGDRLYFGAQNTKLSSQDGFIVCLDRETGEVKWKIGEDEEMLPVFCTPRVVDGRLYCGEGLHENKDCRMFCLNAGDGKPAWAQPIKTTSHTEGSPAVAGGKVFFPAGDDGLFAVDAKTGSQLWQFPGGKEKGIHVDAPPAVSGNRVFIGSGLYNFVAVCLDADSGQEKWRTDLKLRAFGAPLVLGKHIFYGVGTGNMGEDVHDYPEEGASKEKDPSGAVVCLELETGHEVWRHELPRSVHTGLAGDSFSIYACSRDGSVYAIDRKTGKPRWKSSIGGAITSAPTAASVGVLPVAVYAVSREGTVVCLNPHTGKVVWQKPLPGFKWDGQEANGVLSSPSVITSTTPTGSKQTIYIGAMTVDPDNSARKTCAVFRFDDELGGE
jgi:outer membrane protein assembly factor BamB